MPSDPISSFEFDSKKLILRLNMTIQGSVEEVTPAVDRIMAVVQDMHCSKGKANEIELALQEALANAVVHGCEEDPSRNVQVCVACDEERGMLIIIRDPGPGFDPEGIPSPVSGENLYAEGGRGIYLINQLMDEVRFEKGGTEIWMRKQ
ncbi:MAG: ATP-binding protein [Thermoanaerobaculia bacterium]